MRFETRPESDRAVACNRARVGVSWVGVALGGLHLAAVKVTILNAVDYSLYRTCCRVWGLPRDIGWGPDSCMFGIGT